MPKKYFTIETAQKKINLHKKRIIKLQNLKKLIDALLSVQITSMAEIDLHELAETNLKLNKEYHKLCHEFYKQLEQLQNSGIIIKDLEQGLIDFYCKFEGREIFLCWKLGEPKLAYWHELETGILGRKKIIDLEEEQKKEQYV